MYPAAHASSNVTLGFQWRTFLADSGDRLRVGFHVGELKFGSDRFQDFNVDFASNSWSTAWKQAIPEPGSVVLAAIGAATFGVIPLLRRFCKPPIGNNC